MIEHSTFQCDGVLPGDPANTRLCGATPRSEAPVFVVGMNGSGTTMLLDHLDAHPEIFGFRIETKILPYYLTRAFEPGLLESDDDFLQLFDEIRAAFPFRAANQGQPVPLPTDWKKYERTPAAIFDYAMLYFAAKAGKKRWAEKSPMHVQHILRLSEAFPSARFIHVMRDGRDCAASFQRRWGYSPLSTIYRWKCAVREGQRQGGQVGRDRYLEIFYEALTSQPETELERICEFVGVDFERAMLRATRDRSPARGIASQTIRANTGTHRDYFSGTQLRRLELCAGKTLASLGYATDCPEGDSNPSAYMLRYWLLRDRVRVGTSAVLSKIRTGQGRSWHLVLLRLKRAVRQWMSDQF